MRITSFLKSMGDPFVANWGSARLPRDTPSVNTYGSKPFNEGGQFRAAGGAYHEPWQSTAYYDYHFNRRNFENSSDVPFMSRVGQPDSLYAGFNNIDSSLLFTYLMREMINKALSHGRVYNTLNFIQNYLQSTLSVLTQLANVQINEPSFFKPEPSTSKTEFKTEAESTSHTNSMGSLSVDQQARAQLCSHLNLPADTTDNALRSAYRKAALECHPDKGGQLSTFIGLNDLYKTWQAGPEQGVAAA